VDAARRAEAEGLDGAFVFDHLWPLGRGPGAPAPECLTLLAAIAAATSSIRVGTLVLRASLRPVDVALSALRSIAEVAPGRLVVGLGAGDRKSAEENRRFGIPFEPARERVDTVRRLAEALCESGIEVWIGGLGREVRQACSQMGLTWSCWGISDSSLVAALEEIPQAHVTWGGEIEPPPFSVPVDEIIRVPS
jgi:alkanesulfonate monooxygenase SsuD/methylene tetrahydromethanopterin reductase-like flavin-dependent oxidoreductase (luciferase family)